MKLKNLLDINDFHHDSIKALLLADTKEDIELLRSTAFETTQKYCGNNVNLRGLIEFSNICKNDCYYCGIRKSNRNVGRYMLSIDEILDAADKCARNGYGSIVLQSGENTSETFISFVEKVVRKIKKSTKSEMLPNGLGITLCVGEQSEQTYKRFFEAGAHRYLLRIETTNEELFKKIHPEYQIFSHRVDCLKILSDIGFQVGTGVMIGLPEQTIDDLANDIMFFKNLNIDMLGMGPFIVHKDTPFNIYMNYYIENKERIYNLALKMIAAARIALRDVNIASTTALQAMNPEGKMQGLMFGANVLMPQLTPFRVRRQYRLYEGKPELDESTSFEFKNLIQNIEAIGRTIAKNEWGDSRHFFNRR